jgi:hypothetical protein
MLQPTAVNGDKSHNSWGSDPRFTALPVKDVLKIRIKDLGLRNADLQTDRPGSEHQVDDAIQADHR